MTRDEIQDKVLSILFKVDRGTAALSGGTGKTLIGLKHMNFVQKGHFKFLVAAPKKSIFQSWKDDAKKFNLEYLNHIVKIQKRLNNAYFLMNFVVNNPQRTANRGFASLPHQHSFLI